MSGLIAGVLLGNRRAIARLITLVESDEVAAETAVTQLYKATGQAHLIGITGPPGSGKSTVVAELTKQLRQARQTVAIIAVDPSSPFTGGALLGDRIRMRDLSGDKDVFIRSMAARHSLGGLAESAWAVAKILDAAGFDKILIETVGAGQSEVDIARAVHTTVVIEAPGMGDDIQSFKSGILEIADILVVNKADRPGADQLTRSLESMIHLGPRGGTRPGATMGGASGGWSIPVQQTSGLTGAGVPELASLIEKHVAYLRAEDQWQVREQDRCRQEIEFLLWQRFRARLQQSVPVREQEKMVAAVADRESDPYTAVNQLLGQLT